MSRRRNDFAEEEEEFRRALDSVPPPDPPDGGWGWVVVFSSFCMNMIVDGVCYSYGILIHDLCKEYNTSLTVMSLGGSLLLGTYMISGPLTCAFCNKFGSRKIALLGCFVTFIALLASLATESGVNFVIIFGLFGGAGFGMMLLSSVLLVGFYFERNRGIAATIATSGSSVGMAAFAPLIRLLLYEYNWYGTIVMITGIVIQGFVLGSLLKPIDADLRRRKKLILKRMEEDKRIGPQTCIIMQRLLEEKRRQRTYSTGSLNSAIITRDNVCVKNTELHKYDLTERIKFALSRTSLNLSTSSQMPSPKISGSLSPSTPHAQPPTIYVNDASPTSSVEGSPVLSRSGSCSPKNLRRQVLLSNTALTNTGLKRVGSSRSLVMTSTQTLNPEDDAAEFQSTQELSTADPLSSSSHQKLIKRFLHATPDVDRPMYRKDIMYTGSIQQLPEYHNNMEEYINSITEIPPELSISDVDCWSHLSFLPKSVIDVLRDLFTINTCKSPTFLLLSFSSSLTMFGYYIPFLLLPVFSYSKGNTDHMQAALLLTVLGVSNTVGRILAGIFGTKKWVDSLAINHIALLVAGGSTLALPFCETFGLQALYAVVFGVCVAAFSSLRSILVVDLIGLNKLTACFNQLYIFHGISVIVGTTIACYLCDSADNNNDEEVSSAYNLALYFAGAAIVISGILSLPLRRVSEWEKKCNGIILSIDSSEDDMKKDSLPKPTVIEMVPH